MKISSTATRSVTRPPARATTPQSQQAQVKPEDRLEQSNAQSPGLIPRSLKGVAKHVGRFARNVALASLPAAATATALAVGGANAAGLALAGSMVVGGAACALLNSGEIDARGAFGAGGMAAFLGAGMGMIAGPVGIAMSAAMGAVWSGVRQIGEAVAG